MYETNVRSRITGKINFSCYSNLSEHFKRIYSNSVLTLIFYLMKLIYRKRGEKSIRNCTEIGRAATKFSEEITQHI